MQDLIARVQLKELREAYASTIDAPASSHEALPAAEVEIGAMRVVVDDVDLEVYQCTYPFHIHYSIFTFYHFPIGVACGAAAANYSGGAGCARSTGAAREKRRST